MRTSSGSSSVVKIIQNRTGGEAEAEIDDRVGGEHREHDLADGKADAEDEANSGACGQSGDLAGEAALLGQHVRIGLRSYGRPRQHLQSLWRWISAASCVEVMKATTIGPHHHAGTPNKRIEVVERAWCGTLSRSCSIVVDAPLDEAELAAPSARRRRPSGSRTGPRSRRDHCRGSRRDRPCRPG